RHQGGIAADGGGAGVRILAQDRRQTEERKRSVGRDAAVRSGGPPEIVSAASRPWRIGPLLAGFTVSQVVENPLVLLQRPRKRLALGPPVFGGHAAPSILRRTSRRMSVRSQQHTAGGNARRTISLRRRLRRAAAERRDSACAARSQAGHSWRPSISRPQR